jgi:hypothetical protein
MFSYGKIPYPGMSNSDTAQKVIEGYRMPAPEDCPGEVYDIMKRCWLKDADQRPSFTELMSLINQLVQKYLPSESTVLRSEIPQDDVNKAFYHN